MIFQLHWDLRNFPAQTLQRPPIVDNKVPGPGSYYNHPLIFEKKKNTYTRPNSSKSSKLKKYFCNRPNTSDIDGFVSKSTLEEFVGVDDFRKEPHTFGHGAGQRFKDTYFGRLDLIEEIPGPGSYTPNLHNQQQNRFSSPFRSRSPKFLSPLKHPSMRPPGPLYYNPIHISDSKTNFYFNRDNSWI